MKFPTFRSLICHRKKIFRFLIRGGVLLVTLIVLFYAAVNWWGAGKRKEAVARLSTSGIPLTLADLMANQPAENDNFSMIPLLKSASEQAWILDDQRRHYYGPPGEKPPQPGPELLMIQTMGTDSLKEFVRIANRTPRSDNPDFSKMDEKSGYGRSAESFLAEFDRRNATALEALRQGMSRPVTETSVIVAGLEKRLSDTFGEFNHSLREAVVGLCLRADAALATGDSAKAAESLAFALRFGEVMGSKGYMISPLLEAMALNEVNKRLALGILQHRWSPENLQNLQSALNRMNIRTHIIKSYEANTLYTQIWWNWSDHRPKDTNEMAAAWNFGDVPSWVSHNVGLFPSGWFDANGAIDVNQAMDFALLVKTPGLLKLWADASRTLSKKPSESTFSQIIRPSAYNGEDIILFRSIYMLVLHRQAILACELERIRLEKGNYPETLDAISPALTNDPLFDSPFLYRKTEDSFRLYSKGPDSVDDHLEHQGRKNLMAFDRPDWEW